METATRTHATIPHEEASLNASCPKVWLGEDGILRIEHGRQNTIRLASIRSAYQQHIALSTRKRPVIVLVEGSARLPHDAALFAVSPEFCAVTSALAIITKSFLAKHFAQMFIRYHRPTYPLQVFSTEAEATVWLKEFPVSDEA